MIQAEKQHIYRIIQGDISTRILNDTGREISTHILNDTGRDTCTHILNDTGNDTDTY